MNNKISYLVSILIGLSILLSGCEKDVKNPNVADEDMFPPSPEEVDEGDTVSGWLNKNINYGTVTDIEGNSYATIRVGDQEWMAENLRTTKYCNGDNLDIFIDGPQWSYLTTGAWAHFNNDTVYEKPYGKLYNWYAVNDERNLCPCGWHVPNYEEVNAFIDTLQGQVGRKMKSVGTQYWESPNTGATNESGFSGLPGGYLHVYGQFEYVGLFGYWWIATESENERAWYYRLSYSNGGFYRGEIQQNEGYSVRCMKD